VNEGNCRGCGAAIRWVVTTTGARMPLDVRFEKRFIRDYDSDKPGIEGVKLADTFTSHFATCPKANEFRKEKKTDG
jgi:hypothetical protein